VVDLLDHISRLRVRIREDLREVVNGAGGHSHSEESIDPLRRRSPRESGFELGHEGAAIRQPRCIRGKPPRRLLPLDAASHCCDVSAASVIFPSLVRTA
jgi:hypothetical protein